MDKTFNLFRDLIAGKTVFEKLEKIWKNYYADNVGENCYSALMQRELRKDSVIFMSINPSLRVKDLANAKIGYAPVAETDTYFIDCKNEDSVHAKDMHFKKFFMIGKKASLESWSTMDILYIRDTMQHRVEDIAKTESGEQFIVDQMKLSFDILEVLKPKVVVVSNNGVVKLIDLYKDKLKLKLDLPNESNGFIYRINGIPFITLQSKYLGSSKWWNRDIKEGGIRLELLVSEIKRITRNFVDTVE